MSHFHSLPSRIMASRLGRAVAVVVVIAAVMLTAAHPSMLGALPDTPDGELHFYRLVALDHATRHDGLWPRYAPGLIFGYGSPIFNYYGPLYLYPSEALHLLGLPFLNAFLMGMILYAILGALGAYLLGEAWGGPVAGIATAVAYAYAPYTLYNWPRRGAVAEFAAMAALPWVLWAFRRLAARGQRRDFALAVVAFALFIPLHNITTLLGTAALVVCCLYWGVQPPPGLRPPSPFKGEGWGGGDNSPLARSRLHTLARLALAGLLGVGLMAFFWLPALGETGYVQLERATEDASADFHNNFDTLAEVFSPPLTADLTQIHPPVPRPLGWPQLVLGAVGIVLAWLTPPLSLPLARGRVPEGREGVESSRRRHPGLRGWLGLALGFVIVFVFLTNESSVWVWEHVPLIHYAQLPWRLVGLASLFLAVLAGAGVALVAARIPRPAVRIAWVALCLAAMMVYAMPWLYGIDLPEPPAESIVDVQNFERETGWIATASLREYTPRWTTELPDSGALVNRYAASEVIPRLQDHPGVTVRSAEWGATSAQLTLDADGETTLVFDWLYFPGWWARVDGEAVSVTPTEPHGFVSVTIPAGEHTLALGLGPTPLRRAADAVSVAALAGWVGLLAFARGLWRQDEMLPAQSLASSLPLARGRWPTEGRAEGVWPLLLAAALVGVAIFAGKALLIDRSQTPILRERFANGVAAGLQTPIQATFGGQLVLLGDDLPDSAVESGGEVPLRLYWQVAGDAVAEDYSSIVTLHDAAGNVLWTGGSQHPGGWPTSRWRRGQYAQERLTLAIPPGTPPGEYTIRVGLYAYSAGRNLDVWDAGGNTLGVTVQVGTLTVTRPCHPASIEELGIGAPLDARLTDDLTLLGVDLPPTSREVGQPLPLVWAWQTEAPPEQVYNAQLLWLDEDGEIAAASEEIAPVVGYPTDAWEPGDVWRGVYTLHIPGGLEAGDYDVAVQLHDPAGDPVGESVMVGGMTVTTPPRTYAIPPMMAAADVTWANGIRLIGCDLPDATLAPGDALHLTLYWQPADEVTTDLKVFVHLVDAEGFLVAQQDQIPLGGARPTLGWSPGEVIADPYTLMTVGDDMPPGDYTIRVGWYDAATWERVMVVDGGDYWELAGVTVVP